MDFDEYYRQRFPTEFADPSYRWHPTNRSTVAFRHQLERAVLWALRLIDEPVETFQVLDVGCGTGGALRYLLELGAVPEALHGVDVLEGRLVKAKQINPGVALVACDSGRGLPFDDDRFDLVSQYVAFSSMLNGDTRMTSAREMLRVLRPGGFLFWYDGVRPNPGSIPSGISERDVRSLFPGVEWLGRRPIHSWGLSRLAVSPLLAAVGEALPIRKTNLVLVGRLAVSTPEADRLRRLDP